MSVFPRILREVRKARQMTQRALADRISKTSAYIAVLEVEHGEREPSLSTLRDIIKVLATYEDSHGTHLDMSIVERLMFGALDVGVESPGFSDDRKAFVESFDGAKVVWVITDSLFEAKSLEYASSTSEKINKGSTFVFLVPDTIAEGQIHDAINNLGLFVQDRSVLEAQMMIFRISNCAHAIRAWIFDPAGPQPQGFYNLGCEPFNSNIRRMGQDRMFHLVQTYKELCGLYHASVSDFTKYSAKPGYSHHRNPPSTAIGRPDLGYIRLAFPNSPLPASAASTSVFQSPKPRERVELEGLAPEAERVPVWLGA